MSDFSETFGSVRDTDRHRPRRRAARPKLDPKLAAAAPKLLEGAAKLLKAASPYMTHRNIAEREAYALLRDAVAEAEGGA